VQRPEPNVARVPRARAAGAPTWLFAPGLALAALGLVAPPSPFAASAPLASFAQGGAGQPGQGTTQSQQMPFAQGYGTADSNSRMIAVTGVDITGASLLYLVDTHSRHLSVYQAIGGADSTNNVRWIGARNIDLDLQVDGWNDKSKLSYKDLAAQFGQSPRGGLDTPAGAPAPK
jgi:hypothetical protein